MVRFVVFAALVSSGLLAATPQSQASQQPPDTSLRFDPVTGEPLAPVSIPAFDPLTGLPVEAPPEKQLPRFDPVTGELIPALLAPAVTTPATAGTTILTESSIIARARFDARRHHSGADWALAGGLLGAGAMVAGGIVGVIYTYSFGGFLLGVVVGAVPAPLLFSSFPVSVPETPQFEETAPGQRETYRQTFIGESRGLRAWSVFKGELAVVAIGVGLLLLSFGL